MNIFFGNLAFSVTDQDLRRLFESYSAVDKVNIITDRDTGRSRGFGFVEMPDSTAAKAAIEGLQGQQLPGRALNVNAAKPRKPRRGLLCYRQAGGDYHQLAMLSLCRMSVMRGAREVCLAEMPYGNAVCMRHILPTVELHRIEMRMGAPQPSRTVAITVCSGRGSMQDDDICLISTSHFVGPAAVYSSLVYTL